MSSQENFNNEWRKVATTIYKKPVDSKIFGQVEVDVTDLERFITNQRKAGLKITLTHIFTLIMARGMKTEVPEFNTFVRRGKIVSRPGIDAMVSVLQADGSMGSVKVNDADKLSLAELEQILKEEILKARRGTDNTREKKNFLSRLPWPFRTWFYKIYFRLTINWGIPIPFVGLTPNSFGSFVVSNIGTLGLDTGYPALMPSSNVAIVLILGGVQKKPVVVNDEVVIRRMQSLSVVIDHRVADASHGGKMFRYFREMIRKPADLLIKPPA